MHSLKATLITAFVIALSFVPSASAQTAAKVAVVSGNGQLVCPGCIFKIQDQAFYPMVVKVTDANGNPIAGKTVNWNLLTTTGFPPPTFAATTQTDNNGLAFSRPSQTPMQGSGFNASFFQSVISASADAASVNFTETVTLRDLTSGTPAVASQPGWYPAAPPTLTGTAGSPGTVPFQINVHGFGGPVPNVSVRILSPEVTLASGQVIIDPNFPSASCVTGPGADPGSVLTDASGNATCTPVFGPGAGGGSVSALVGGVDPIEFDQTKAPNGWGLTQPIAYDQYPGIQLGVTQVTPGQVLVDKGNNQTVNPGQASLPLVVKVTDLAGAVSIANQDVNWTVISGAATVSPVASKTDTLGQTQAIVTFSPIATGQVTVRAALTGSYTGISTTFTLSSRVVIASLAQVSGDLQTTQSGQSFPSPLIVQVLGNNGQPLSNQPIGFAVTSGAATLSTLAALTDATGQARVTVTAGSTPGTVTIRAFLATFFQNFTLTVIPPGPALSDKSFYNAGGLTKIGALSPCSLVTVIAAGLAPNVEGLVFNTTSFGPWATSLDSDTVTVNGFAAPIYSVGKVNGTEQLTFQVPCETAPATAVPITINVGRGTATIIFPVVAASPGIFETVMTDGIRRAVVVRPDGTFVSLENPARRGELVRVFVTGLGPTVPAMVTGSVPVPAVDSLALAQVIVGIDGGGTRVVTSRISPNLIGVYEVTFEVPSDAKTGNDVVLSVDINAGEFKADGTTPLIRYSNGSKLPIK